MSPRLAEKLEHGAHGDRRAPRLVEGVRREDQDLHTASARSTDASSSARRRVVPSQGIAGDRVPRAARPSASGAGGSPSSVLRNTTSLKVDRHLLFDRASHPKLQGGRAPAPWSAAPPTSGVSAVRQARGAEVPGRRARHPLRVSATAPRCGVLHRLHRQQIGRAAVAVRQSTLGRSASVETGAALEYRP